jgi:GNAT superfamily N-acetyltransferase
MYYKDDRPRPTRIRLTGLQEGQLADLVKVDAACAAMFHGIGFDHVRARSESEIVTLTTNHNVHVVEADHVPAGFLAWRDESPGIAYLAHIAVHPDYQRFGIGSKLLQALRDEARTLRLPYIIVRAWERAPWTMAFYRLHGFGPIGAGAPAHVLGWRDEHTADGKPLTQPGEIVLWTDVGAAPVITYDDEQTEPGEG